MRPLHGTGTFSLLTRLIQVYIYERNISGTYKFKIPHTQFDIHVVRALKAVIFIVINNKAK